MLIVSCDPGLTGALALLCTQRGLLECVDIPTCGNGVSTGSMKRWVDVAGLKAIFAGWSAKYELAQESVHVAIERPIPMPTLPAQTVASQFDTFGTIRSVAQYLWGQSAMNIVAPKDWKKPFGLRADKNAARACCLRLYPNAPVKLVKHHNRADAILVGHWLRMELA